MGTVIPGSGNSALGTSDGGENPSISKAELDILDDVPPPGSSNVDKDEDEEEEEQTPPVKKTPPEEDEEKEEEDEELEDEDTDDEDEDEEKDLDEDEEDDEEKDEVDQPSVNFKEISKEFPGIFKKHPELRAAVARDHSYRQLLPTIEDAKDAVDKANAIDFLGENVAAGNFKPLLKSLGKEPENLKVFAKTVLNDLGEIDKSLRTEALLPHVKALLRNALASGIKTQNKTLSNSAQHLAIYLFDKDWQSVFSEQPESKTNVEDPEKKKLKEQLEQAELKTELDFKRSVFSESYSELQQESKKVFLKFEKQYPEKKLTKLQKEAIFDRSLKIIGKKLDKDADHMRKMDRLFDEAKKAGYSLDKKPSVKSAYLGRAKNLLSKVQQKLVREELALEDEEQTPPVQTKQKNRVPPNPTRNRTKQVEKDPNKAFKGVSDLEYLEA